MTSMGTRFSTRKPAIGDGVHQPAGPIPRSAADRRVFLRSWLRDPWKVAAIAPSGDALARLITSEISAQHAPVIELGAGSGAFTRALIARGVPEHRIALVEQEPVFVSMLRRRFPQACMHVMDATRLSDTDIFVKEPAGAIVSGLPLLSMRAATVSAVLQGAFRQARNDAAFYQFTYGPCCPVPEAQLAALQLRADRLGWTAANLPPAAVYRFRRVMAQ